MSSSLDGGLLLAALCRRGKRRSTCSFSALIAAALAEAEEAEAEDGDGDGDASEGDLALDLDFPFFLAMPAALAALATR